MVSSFSIYLSYLTSRFCLWTPFEGAQTIIYCAVQETLEGVSANYYDNCKEAQPSRHALNMDMAKQLWGVSMELIGDEEKLNVLYKK